MPSLRLAASVASRRGRVQGVTGQQTVRSTGGIVRRIIASNANAAVQTLTLLDGATTLIVLRIPAGSTISVPVDLPFATSILATPSSVDVDALFIYD